MKISRCIKNPVLYIRKALYYAIGNTVARMFYPPRLYKSVWFSGLSSLGVGVGHERAFTPETVWGKLRGMVAGGTVSDSCQSRQYISSCG